MFDNKRLNARINILLSFHFCGQVNSSTSFLGVVKYNTNILSIQLQITQLIYQAHTFK